MKRIKGIRYINLILLFFLSVVSLKANAQTLGRAYVFYFTNLGIGGGESVYNDLVAMGYTSEIDDDRDAEEIVGVMGNASVFVYIGHGTPGVLECAGDTRISALQVSGQRGYVSLEGAYADTIRKLSGVKLIYYGSCFSNAFSPEFGRLTTYTAENLSAGAVIGFDNSVSDRVTTRFEEAFFGFLRNNYTVQTAINLAKADAQATFPSTYETSNVGSGVVFGNGNIIIGSGIS